MKGLSIDIGVHNMAFYIEEFDVPSLQKIKCPLVLRYDKNGCSTDKFKEVLKEVYENGNVVFLDLVNLSEHKGVEFDLSIFINLTNYLDSQKEYFNDCSFILIEQQLKENPMAQRLEQHCVSWFTFNYLNTKEIIIFPAKNKTQVLGAPKKMMNKKENLVKMTKSQRKKWACEEATKVLMCRNDIKNLHNMLTNVKKRDDISDTIVMLQSFKIKCFIDKKIR